jgi:putative copper resistance protein D
MSAVIFRLGIFLLALTALSASLIYGGGAWASAPDGIPDAGQGTSWLLQFGTFAHVVLSLRIFGLLTTWAFLAPTTSETISKEGRGAILKVSKYAAAWSVVSVVNGIATLAVILGIPFSKIFNEGVIGTYIWSLPASRNYLITALIALGISLGAIFLVSLNSIALLLAGTAAGILSPLLNSHSASMGDHSLALASSLAHGLAMSAWVGCLWAVLEFVKARNLEVVNRFSVLATVSVAVLAISGVAASYTRLDSISDLWLSRYGQLVVIKVVLFIGLLGLAKKIRNALASTGAVGKFLIAETSLMALAVGIGVALHSTPMSRSASQLPSAAEEILGFPFPPAPAFSSVVFGWHPEWFLLSGALIAAALYTIGFVRLKRNGIKWSKLRLASFLTGIGFVIWTTCAGISMYAAVSFQFHMIQHMMLSMIAPIFIVLSTPITLALRALPATHSDEHRNSREWVLALLHSRYSQAITHPLVVLVIFTFGLYGMYFTPLFGNLMGSHVGHVFMEIHFFLSGTLFAFVIIGADPSPREVPYWSRLIIVLVGLSLHTFFALAIMQSTTPIGAEWYSQVQPPWITDLLADTYAGGGVAWALGEIPTLILMVAVGVMWSRSDTKLAKRQDRAADRDGDAELNAYNEQLRALNNRDNN